jgi:tRNA (guanine37-N1)-methyltransferase
MKSFDVVTLFPDMFEAVTEFGVTQRARDRGIYQLVLWNPRDFSSNNYRSVDDRPYGGGPGMVMMAEPLSKAIRAARQRQKSANVGTSRTVYLTPQGRPLDQKWVEQLAAFDGLVMLAGRYEGVDERLIQREIDEEISMGDYVVSGGELPAMMLIDAIVRREPGALNDDQSIQQDSFVSGLLDHPHYTRPDLFEDMQVPAVLMSGNHAEIRRWRLKQSIGRTWQRRPDMLEATMLDAEQRDLLAEYRAELTELEKPGV